MSQPEAGVHDDRERRGSAAVVILGVMLVFGVLVLPFVPLILALIEGMTLGTQRVEEFCRDIGMHEALGKFYRTVFFWLK